MNITERIEQQAAQWLERREQPDWSDDDRATLDAWLDASIAHKLAYWRLEHGWTKVGRLAALRQVPPPVIYRCAVNCGYGSRCWPPRPSPLLRCSASPSLAAWPTRASSVLKHPWVATRRCRWQTVHGWN